MNTIAATLDNYITPIGLSPSLQRPTLVLNRNWQPINVATVARALIMLWNDSVMVSSLHIDVSQKSPLLQKDKSQLSALLRGELDWIVLMAIDKDRSRRYPSFVVINVVYAIRNCFA